MGLNRGFIFYAFVISVALHVLVGLCVSSAVWGGRETIMPSASRQGFYLTWVGTDSPATLGQDHEVVGQPAQTQLQPAQSDEQGRSRQSVATDELVQLAPPVDWYLPPSQLTKIPQPMHDIVTTPSGVPVEGLVGRAQILLLISERGEVDAALIEASSLPEEVAAYARAQFKKARFLSGEVDGQSVKSRIRVIVEPQAASQDAGHLSSVKNRRKERPL